MQKTLVLLGLIAIGITACNTQDANSTENIPAVSQTQTTEITFQASDGQTVYGDAFTSHGSNAPLIILFHQAGSNGRGEYKSITPKLVANGYNVLQIDQRSGGGRFGSSNRTVKSRGGKTKYCPAYADMEGALAHAKSLTNGPIFAWGSSYSAALTLKLAGEHGADLAGALSFSPASGGGMGECAANTFIKTINIPTLGLRPRSEMTKAGGIPQKAMFEAQGLNYFVAEDGVHGSSMLDPSRAKGDTAPTWAAVLTFLNKHK